MRYLALTFLASSILLSGCAVNKPNQTPEQIAAIEKQNVLLKKAEAATSSEETISNLKEAGAIGSGKAYYELAKIYATDKRVNNDYTKANDYLAKADALGDTNATMMLAWNNMYGLHTAKNEDRGVELMEKAAESDHRAKREMGLMYGNLRHPFLDKPSKGLKLLNQASEEGDLEAPYYAYLLATRLKKEDQANEALTEAVKRNQPKALLIIGRDAVKNGSYMIARWNFLKAALANDSEAMYELGKGVSEGIFPPTQTVKGISKEAEAIAWLSEASSQQHLQAKELLTKLRSDTPASPEMESQVNTVIKSIKEQNHPWNPNQL